ncbi:MAG: alkaline phosphatase [Bryobacteraceae bacterium]
MIRRVTFLFLLSLASGFAADRAKNVIIFLADAGGLPTVNAASLHGYNAPQKLFVQSWPHIALSDTSAANAWVTDSAAGMTAIVTGVKTNNNYVSNSPTGQALKSIVEYAEEKGLSTGAITNMPIADATPAALYAHNNDRSKWGDIFLQLFQPRFGDGVDFVVGAGRTQIYQQAAALGKNPDEVAKAAKRTIYDSLGAVPADNMRPVVVQTDGVDVAAASRRAVEVLSKNRKGYVLMIEWDAHTDNPRVGLDNLVNFDKLIRELSAKVNLKDTLLLFTADHSFEIQLTGGKPGDPVLPSLKTGRLHTGEEVVVAAQGAGSEQVKGFLPNTRLFQVMMDALGWKP